MGFCRYTIGIFFYLTFGATIGNCRKYDIEAESQKLYGEDLQSVLKRFRKTPEYSSILEDKFIVLKRNIEFIVTDLQSYYENKINDKVEEILGANLTYLDDAKRMFMRERYQPFRRQSEDALQPPKNISGVERIDSYKKLRSALSVEQRNNFKDLGFEFTGHIVHGLINALSGDDQQSSTLLPYGSDDDNNNQHSTHQHQVTHEETTVMEDNPTTSEGYALHTHPPESFRNYQPHNVI